MSSKWYIKDNINPGEFIPNLSYADSQDIEVIELDSETESILRELFKQPFYNDRSRCISFYRDTITLDDKIYNICLSCKDINVDGEDKSISIEQGKILQDLKQKLRNKTTARDFIEYDERRFPNHEELMIKFAQFHVEQFKKKIQKEGSSFFNYDATIDVDILDKLYPNENIK